MTAPAAAVSRPASGAEALRRLRPETVILIGALVTLLALVESWRAWPYAPFPVLHAAFAIAIPLWLRLGPEGRPWREIRRHLPGQGLPIAVAVAFIAGFIGLYAALLGIVDSGSDPSWNLIAAYRELWDEFVERHGPAMVAVATYVLLGVWPMVGEELFYRGFLVRGLLGPMPAVAACGVASFLFGLRHAFQLSYLLPSYPLGAAIAYFVWAFGLGMIWSWVYVRTGSLWLCIASHSPNLVLAPAMIAILGR